MDTDRTKTVRFGALSIGQYFAGYGGAQWRKSSAQKAHRAHTAQVVERFRAGDMVLPRDCEASYAPAARTVLRLFAGVDTNGNSRRARVFYDARARIVGIEAGGDSEAWERLAMERGELFDMGELRVPPSELRAVRGALEFEDRRRARAVELERAAGA